VEWTNYDAWAEANIEQLKANWNSRFKVPDVPNGLRANKNTRKRNRKKRKGKK
jgi:hypothetical protein